MEPAVTKTIQGFCFFLILKLLMANWMLNPVAGQSSLHCIVYIFSLDMGSLMKQILQCAHTQSCFLTSLPINVFFIDN